MKNSIIDMIIKSVGILMLSTLAGFVLLCLVYMIPSGSIEKTREDMHYIMENETPGMIDTRFFTYAYGSKNNPETFIYALSGLDQSNPLFFRVVGEENEGDNRYWDGFMVIMLPLMTFLSFGQIRYLLTLLSVILIWYIITRSKERLPWYFSLSFVVGLVFINMIVNLFNVLTNMVFLVAFAFMAYLLKNYTVKTAPEKLYYLFLLNGILTTYLDRFTACLLSLEMPLLVIVLINIHDNGENSLINNLKNVFYSVLGWGIGFSVFWFNKWAISGLVLRKNILNTTFKQIFMRSGTNASTADVFVDGYKGNRFFTIAKNIAALIPTHGENVTAVIVIIAIIAILMISYLIYRRGSLKNIRVWMPVLFLMILPYIYYFVFSNLCQIHATFYMYRMQLVTVTGIIYIYFEALRNGGKDKDSG